MNFLDSIKFIIFNNNKLHCKIIMLCLSWINQAYAAQNVNDVSWIFRKYEHYYNIPHGLLEAIALNESGQSNVFGKLNPNPWAVNVDGKSFYHSSKNDAINSVKQLQKIGHKSIDVGCMQINLKHHPKAFSNLEQAFDPEYNIHYAGQFLAQLKKKFGTWDQAVAYYHSQTEKFHIPYKKKVLSMWEKLRKKISGYEVQKAIKKEYPKNQIQKNNNGLKKLNHHNGYFVRMAKQDNNQFMPASNKNYNPNKTAILKIPKYITR